MATEELTLSTVIPASPNRVYAAWMDERQHSAVTGANARVDSWVGGRHSWADGEVEGHFVRLETGRRILMTWRSAAFPDRARNSLVDVSFEPVAGGTKVTICHQSIPEGQRESYQKGWRRHYLTPFKRCFSRPAGLRDAMQASTRRAARKTAPLASLFTSAPRAGSASRTRKSPPAPRGQKRAARSTAKAKTSKKAATKKAATKKAATKKAATKKAATKKPHVKKAPTKKSAAKKSAAKKSAAKKSGPHKKVNRKPASAKKPARRGATPR